MELSDGTPSTQPQPTQAPQETTTFTVDLGQVELSADETNAIMNDITKSAMNRASQLRTAVNPARIIFGRFGSFGSFGRVVAQQ
jgi:hypothetical protein